MNGQQNGGNAQDNCNIHKLNHNCPAQPNWNGANTHLFSFPTYWDLRRCSQTEFRIAYNVYFTKDTGHRHDIEWVILVWGSNDGGKTFYRSRMIFEQDGSHPSKQWGDIQNTFSNGNDQLNLGQKNQNHARVFVSKWHHSMHDDRYTQFKNTCPPNSVSDFRTDDYYFFAADNLQPMDSIPSKQHRVKLYADMLKELTRPQPNGTSVPPHSPVDKVFATTRMCEKDEHVLGSMSLFKIYMLSIFPYQHKETGLYYNLIAHFVELSVNKGCLFAISNPM